LILCSPEVILFKVNGVIFPVSLSSIKIFAPVGSDSTFRFPVTTSLNSNITSFLSPPFNKTSSFFNSSLYFTPTV